ncbi:hypothetical protein JCM3765_000351 [Sporobolomyces pararoseus]
MSALFSAAKDGGVPILVLDGGMGTTLQSYPVAQQLDSNLWSSELLKTKEGRETLEDLHSKWIEAGADVVQTCTYQSSLPLFLPSDGPYPSELLDSSLELMNSAIPLLTELPHPANCSHSPSEHKTLTSLSLGPFGASLQPGQEYAGLYPPPFGPTPSISPSRIASGQQALDSVPLPLDLFSSSSKSATPEDYLSAWHLLRLRHFSKSSQFSTLSMLSFETVPNLYEARAIRRAMTQFRRETGSTTPFYISYVFPLVGTDTPEERVKLPDHEFSETHETLEDQAPFVIEATFGQLKEEEILQADGIGFNCTSPLHSKRVTQVLTSAYESFVSSSSTSTSTPSARPFFVLYPDGGAVYDVKTRTWSHPLGLTDDKWANLVVDAMQVAREGKVWSGVIGGGCCKASVAAIAALRTEVEKRAWR